MLKKPNSKLKRYIGITASAVFVVEALGFVVSYAVWHKLNTQRDFRYYMHKNYNWVLDSYYSLGETFGDTKTREVDHKVWSNEGKI